MGEKSVESPQRKNDFPPVSFLLPPKCPLGTNLLGDTVEKEGEVVRVISWSRRPSRGPRYGPSPDDRDERRRSGEGEVPLETDGRPR